MGALTFTFQPVLRVGKKGDVEVNTMKPLTCRSSQSSRKAEWWESKTKITESSSGDVWVLKGGSDQLFSKGRTTPTWEVPHVLPSSWLDRALYRPHLHFTLPNPSNCPTPQAQLPSSVAL